MEGRPCENLCSRKYPETDAITPPPVREIKLPRMSRKSSVCKGLQFDDYGLDAEGDVEDDRKVMVESIENLEDTKGYSTKEWVSMLGPSTEIANRFKSFLRNYVNEHGQFVFCERMREMCKSNMSSFVVEFPVLVAKEHILAYFLPEAPQEMLQIFDKVAKDLVLNMFPMFPQYETVCEINVKVAELPCHEAIAAFQNLQLNQLVITKSVVTATAGVKPPLTAENFVCAKCGLVVGPFFYQENNEVVKPRCCTRCLSTDLRREGSLRWGGLPWD